MKRAASSSEALARFVLGRGGPPTDAALRASRLEAYAFTALEEGHPRRVAFRPAFLASLARHHRIRTELLPLLRAWDRAGVDVLLFKGFHLAEWIYPVPGTRFHGDVDVLIRPGQEEGARRVAREAGWGVASDSALMGRPYLHCAFELLRANGDALVEVHRHVVHSRVPWNRLQRRITASVWDRAVEREWEGVRLWHPEPTDALLVGLVLQRKWGDLPGWKAHDPLDARFLVERGGADPAALPERAAELGCSRTAQLFLERWDADASAFDPTPRRGDRRRWMVAAVRDGRTFVRADRWVARAVRSPGGLADVAAALPHVLRARRALRGEPDVRVLLDGVTPATSTQAALPDGRPEWRMVRGVRWASFLLPENPGGNCLLRSLALFRMLRRAGLPATFVSGVEREGDRVVGHAWVELEGLALDATDRGSRARYRVVFVHPEPSAAEFDSSAVRGAVAAPGRSKAEVAGARG